MVWLASGTNARISQHVETHNASRQWSTSLDRASSQLVKIREVDNGQTGETAGGCGLVFPAAEHDNES